MGRHPLAQADPATIRASVPAQGSDAAHAFGNATLAQQMWSSRQLFEVVVDFWANHLNVPTPGPGSWDVGARTTVTSSGPTRWARSPTCSWPRGATRRCSGT